MTPLISEQRQRRLSKEFRQQMPALLEEIQKDRESMEQAIADALNAARAAVDRIDMDIKRRQRSGK